MLTRTNAIDPRGPLKSPGKRCAKCTTDLCHPHDFPCVPANPMRFAGILRASPVLSLQPSVFRRIPGVHFPSLPFFLPYSPTFAGGVLPWAKYQRSDPALNQLEASSSVHKRAGV
jgi:hypothetical protein